MKRHPNVLIVYKGKGSSGASKQQGGLAGNAWHTQKYLEVLGVPCWIHAVESFEEASQIRFEQYTHVIFEALWAPVDGLVQLAVAHPAVQFVARSHSKIGFLQVEPQAIVTMRDLMLGLCPNLKFSSNNAEFSSALEEAYGSPSEVTYLPNLYFRSPTWRSRHKNLCPVDHSWDSIAVASFGASRLLKMHPNAALTALQLGSRLDVDVEFYINSDDTPGGRSVRMTMYNMFEGMEPNELHEVRWADRQDFSSIISKMDLVMQLSATESFCHVAADAVDEAVPVLASHAISWLPAEYLVNPDDTSSCARMAEKILRNPQRVARMQSEALDLYLAQAEVVWRKWLGLAVPNRKGWWK